ncbi:MAG: CHAD domain-containing protein [Nannocystaceae bacterium]
MALPWGQAAHAHLQRYRARLEVGPPEAFDDAEVIRRRRVALRRLRTVLLLAGDADAMAEADKPLRRLARELGAVRDADVALAAVREHGRAAVGTLEQAALDELEAKLARRRRRARDRAATRWTETALAHALAGFECASAAWLDDVGQGARKRERVALAVHAKRSTRRCSSRWPTTSSSRCMRSVPRGGFATRSHCCVRSRCHRRRQPVELSRFKRRSASTAMPRCCTSVRERIDRAPARQRVALARGLEPTLAALRARRSHAWIELDAAL